MPGWLFLFGMTFRGGINDFLSCRITYEPARFFGLRRFHHHNTQPNQIGNGQDCPGDVGGACREEERQEDSGEAVHATAP